MSEKFPSREAPVLSAEKRATYEELSGGVPDAIFILARNAAMNEASGTFKSGSYGAVDIHGNLAGGKARSVAAAELHRYFPNSTVVTNSNIKTEPVSYAQVTAQEVEKRGVPQEKIVIQEDSYSTFTELLELIKLVVANGWKNVAVVVNEFQISRPQAMLEHIDELHDPNGYWKKPDVQEALAAFKNLPDVRIHFVSAEDVLVEADPHYKAVVDAARALPAWKELEAKEQAAANQVRNGEYWKSVPSTLVKQ